MQAATSGARKRPRSNNNADEPTDKNNSSRHHNNNVAADLQTPHTHRLLRLLEEGTKDHAQQAASRLTELSQRASPQVLWDLVGRLADKVLHGTAQRHAAWALQGVASSLPQANQEDFLTMTEPNVDPQLWLTVDLVEKHLDQILTEGTLLLAASGEEVDETLNQSSIDDDNSISGRIRRQRRLLAQRLGLNDILQATGDYTLGETSDLISDQDLIETNASTVEEKSSSSQPSCGILRALLVSEITKSHGAHDAPQQVLATELLFHMFHPDWHVRQGALLGILALLKAWWTPTRNSSILGAWPQDILSRSICVLVLDRFGDYAVPEKMVAPVRLAAAQVVALLYRRANDSTQTHVVKVLNRLSQCQPHWEVRHGALLAVQFLVAVQDSTEVARQLLNLAMTFLQDPAQDVVAAAAQLLWIILRRHASLQQDLVDQFPSILEALIDSDNLSASILPLSQVMAQVIPHAEIREAKLTRVISRLEKLLNVESSAVQIAVLDSVARVVPKLQVALHNETLSDCVASLLKSILESFFASFPYVDSATTRQRIFQARDDAWASLVVIAPQISQRQTSLCTDMILRLVNQTNQSALVDTLLRRRQAGAAVAQLLLVLAQHNKASFVQTVLLALLHSPSQRDCETACILFSCLQQQKLHHLELLEANVRITLWRYVEGAPLPPCLQNRIAERYHSNGLKLALTKSWGQTTRSAPDLEGLDHLLSPLPESQPTDTRNVDVMRMLAFLASAVVSGDSLPLKITPAIRALMTSLRSEPEAERIGLTCDALVHLMHLLAKKDKYKIRDKVLGNICHLIEINDNMAASAAQVITLLVRSLAEGKTLQDLPPVWHRISPLATSNPSSLMWDKLRNALTLTLAVSRGVFGPSALSSNLVRATCRSLILIACASPDSGFRAQSKEIIILLARSDSSSTMDATIPLLVVHLQDSWNDSIRVGACKLLHEMIGELDTEICPFVRYLLPIVMSLMTDAVEECSREATNMFADLVQVAPLVRGAAPVEWSLDMDDHAKSVMDHLIQGQPLPPCILPDFIKSELKLSGGALREYQAEGVAWLDFLRRVKLNGSLCDSMGLGKTLQALVAVALAHSSGDTVDVTKKSLVVVPASLVGHWAAEARRFFPTLFRPLVFVGNLRERCILMEGLLAANLIVTSYSVLRSDIEKLRDTVWEYCILDEGHLLRNPKTATAMALRQIRSNHRLILTGTPIQNHVNELWAAFDFLMPNFLGSHASFGKKFAQPISKGQQVGASASAISSSMERLKVLHQQVLPFILRRQKEQVLKELPPKTISDIPCSLTSEQRALYASLCQRTEVQCSISALKNTLDSANDQKTKLGSDAFKSLLYLRLVCTHPSLVTMSTSDPKTRQNDTSQLQRSGKLRALGDLLRTAGIAPRDLTAADYDASSLYVDAIPCAEVEESLTTDSSRDDHKVSVFDNPFMKMTEYGPSNNKCLIFAQFIRSLDIVEKFLLNDHMPSVRYLRLDGKVASKERSVIVERFNQDETVRILLLTTRVGGLGLNLTGANIVVLLEHDFNPFADLQAMDRAHRIGQGKTVQVYRLVTSDTIEEKIMALQKSKIQTSNAIVNTDNSSMYSMGTDRLLDIFTLRSEMGSKEESSKRESKPVANSTWDVRHLNDLLDDTEEEYQSLGVEAFLQDLRHS